MIVRGLRDRLPQIDALSSGLSRFVGAVVLRGSVTRIRLPARVRGVVIVDVHAAHYDAT